MTRKRQRIKVGEEYDIEGLGYDGEKLTCGLCGRCYQALNVHIQRTHRWTLDDYRKEFGLNRTQPLWTPQLSQRIGECLRERGLVGQNLRFDLNDFTSPHNHSIQARHELSVGGIGKVMTMTPAKVDAQRDNQRKAQIMDIAYTCSLCGKTYFGRRCDKKRPAHYCPECKPTARLMIIHRWRMNHPDKVGEYTRRYRERRKLTAQNA